MQVRTGPEQAPGFLAEMVVRLRLRLRVHAADDDKSVPVLCQISNEREDKTGFSLISLPSTGNGTSPRKCSFAGGGNGHRMFIRATRLSNIMRRERHPVQPPFKPTPDRAREPHSWLAGCLDGLMAGRAG